MKDWLWHLLNDPMRENPWSLGFMILLLALWIAVATSPMWRRRP